MKTMIAALCALALCGSAAFADEPPQDEAGRRTVTVPWRRPQPVKPAAEAEAPKQPAEPETPKLPTVPKPAKTPEQIAAEKAAAEAWAAQALAEEERAAADKARKERERAAAAKAAEPLAPPLSATLNPAFRPPAPALTAPEAAWHSALLPGWGQIKTDRPYRGYAFLGATGASLLGAVILTVRAKQADNIYQSAPPSVQLQAYDQARSYANSRNALWTLTALLWGLNVAESYFLHGTRDR